MADPARFRLVVFDLDGTLVDTRRDLAEATNALLTQLGGAPLDEAYIGGLVGQGVAVWLARAVAAAGLPPGPPDLVARFMGLYDERLLNHTRPYAGLAPMLAQAAAGARLTVLTNKLRGATVKILDGLDLARYFTEIDGVDGPYPPKPAPAGLLAQIQRAGVTPAETLLVGDSPVDRHTALNAGAHICVARYGFGYVASEPADGALFIDQPEDLTAHLYPERSERSERSQRRQP